MRTINQALAGWFEQPGAYVLVDGQFGSTGKGLMAGVLAEYGAGAITHCTTNAGPNSGHTAYLESGYRAPDPTATVEEALPRERKIVTQQVPVASAFLSLMGYPNVTYINAGAMVEEEILRREVEEWLDYRSVYIHPNAAMITPDDVTADKLVVSAIAGTGKGTGPALARKVMRDPRATAESVYQPMLPPATHGFQRTWDRFWDWDRDVVFVETAQGYSLGLNSSRFYPHVTSRECTVMQALADARIPAQMLRKVIACFRTFPIRVGNTENSSGDCYIDQHEISFADIGQPDEITTVTKRVRRLFTWSRLQFRESIAANRPDVIFLNFMNYLPEDERADFVADVVFDYERVMGKLPDAILAGYGPRSSDVVVWPQ